MNLRHMSPEEIVSHIEKFGTDEQRLLVEKLWVNQDEVSPSEYYADCPYCEEKQVGMDNASDALSEARKIASCIIGATNQESIDAIIENIEDAELSLSL